MNRRRHPSLSTVTFFIFIAIAATYRTTPVVSLVLLRDLPTPSFVIDLEALRRRVGQSQSVGDAESNAFSAPSIRCPKNGLLLRPASIGRGGGSSNEKDSAAATTTMTTTVDCDFEFIEGQPAIGYLHSSVVRGREDAVPGMDDPLSTYLAEIDLDPALCRGRCAGGSAQLVLGLNNHHVGGYYWARSAGAGSSMEAPGVWFGEGGGVSDDADGKKGSRGLLRWLDEGGPTACNSNDGKRSEWVNFLRKEDTVQLVPADGQGTLLQFSERFSKHSAGESEDKTSSRIFGISSKGRPIGSEPEVVCEWTLV